MVNIVNASINPINVYRENNQQLAKENVELRSLIKDKDDQIAQLAAQNVCLKQQLISYEQWQEDVVNTALNGPKKAIGSTNHKQHHQQQQQNNTATFDRESSTSQHLSIAYQRRDDSQGDSLDPTAEVDTESSINLSEIELSHYDSHEGNKISPQSVVDHEEEVDFILRPIAEDAEEDERDAGIVVGDDSTAYNSDKSLNDSLDPPNFTSFPEIDHRTRIIATPSILRCLDSIVEPYDPDNEPKGLRDSTNTREALFQSTPQKDSSGKKELATKLSGGKEQTQIVEEAKKEKKKTKRQPAKRAPDFEPRYNLRSKRSKQ